MVGRPGWHTVDLNCGSVCVGFAMPREGVRRYLWSYLGGMGGPSSGHDEQSEAGLRRLKVW